MSTEFERQPGQADKHRHLTAQGSDNDANERPVREKLRDTSIAPKPDFERLPSQGAINHEKPSAIDKKDTSCTISSVSNAVPHIDLHRGRPGRKRSFNDIEANAAVEAWSAEPHENRVKGHPRKRSRDAPNVSKSDDKTPNDHSYQEASTGNIAFLNQFRAISASPTHTHGEHGEKGGLKDDREEILGCDAAFSPRKKRSREQVDTDIQREQKIVATEEAKASRGSDEIQRTDERSQTASQSTRSAHESEAVKLETEPTDLIDPVPIESHPEKVTRDFLSPSTVESATRQFTAADTSAQFQGPAITTKSSNAFSASGLAASARNPTSGFGDLGSSFTSRAGQSIFSASSFSPMNDLEKGRTIAGAQSTSIGSFGSPKPSAFTLGPSPGSLGPSPFQTSNFGVGLSVQGILSSGSTVRSFAASNGDVDLGKPKSGSKSSAFGAPEKSGEESNSDNEVEAASESGGDASTQNLKFQQKEVDTGEEGEDSIYVTGRSSLYGFGESQWRERGKGVFKLNVRSMSSKDSNDGSVSKSARFIMRAHQTHRVLLNTPVFKEMKFGNSMGEKPSNRSITFAVAEDDKLTPYTLKLGDVGEAQTLYQTVKTLQDDL